MKNDSLFAIVYFVLLLLEPGIDQSLFLVATHVLQPADGFAAERAQLLRVNASLGTPVLEGVDGLLFCV